MKEWLVDTNVILDVIGADPEFGHRSRLALEQTAAVAGFGLISRDRGYGQYFRIDLLDPTTVAPPSLG